MIGDRHASAPAPTTAPVQRRRESRGRTRPDDVRLRGLSFDEQVTRLQPPVEPEGGAPVQLKKSKKGFKKGTELTEHKAGTKGAKEDYLALMDGGDDFRATKLKGLLTERKSSKNQLFYHVQMLVSGDNAGLEAAYEKASGGTKLTAALAERLSQDQYVYVLHCLQKGEPQLEDKFMLALGYLTGTAADTKEVILLFEEAKDTEKVRVWDKMSGVLTAKLGGKADRLRTQVDTIKSGLKKKEDDDKGEGGLGGAREREQQLLARRDDELEALAKTCRGKLNLKRDKLAEVLPGWAGKQDAQTLEYVTRDDSKFVTYLKGQVNLLFSKSDMRYAVEMVKNAKPVEDWFFQDGENTDEMEGKKKEKREKERKEEGATGAELSAYMDRKERDNTGLRTLGVVKDRGWRWHTLKEKIEGMSPEQKDAYLYSLMTPDEQQLWTSQDTPFSVKQALRKQVIMGALRDKLKAMGMTGGGNATKTRKKLQEAFQYGATDNTIDGGSTYQRILSHSKEDMGKPAFGKKALALIRKLRGAEFAQVRGNTTLMTNLEQKSSSKYWGYIQAALGVTSGQHDQASGEVEKDVLNASDVVGKRKHDRDEAQDIGANEAELMPGHWGMLLTAALKHARILRRTEVNSLVTRAYMAGKRRERATKSGPLELSGDRKLSPMGATEFVKAVHESISAGAKKTLESNKKGKLKNAYNALIEGTRPSVDEQLEDAEFRSPFKKTSGAKANQAKVETLFEDLEGRALLDEWSNIEEYRALFQRMKIAFRAGNQEETAELVTCLQNFVIDVRDDRRDDLKRMLTPAEVVKSQNKLRKKLVGAMKSDSEVVEHLEEVHFVNDELSQARTKNLALADEQKQRSTGAQYNTFLGGKGGLKNPLNGKQLIGASASSAEAKESMGTLLGRTRKAQSELGKGDKTRGQVVKDNAKGIEEAQEEMERRGTNFDQMRKAYNKIAMGIIKAFVTLVLAAAMTAATVATGGAAGGLLAVGLVAAKVLIKSTVTKLAQSALEGDSFNTEKAIWDVVFSTLVATAGAAIGAIAVPEILGALGEEVVSVGDGLTTATEFAAPTDAGHAAWRTALEKGAKVGFKGMMKTALAQARSRDDNPAMTKVVLAQMGGLVLQVGGAVGASALKELEEDTTEPTTQKLVGSGAKASGYVSKGGKQLYKRAESLFGPEETIHGKDLGGSLARMVPGALERAQLTLDALWDQHKNLDEGEDKTELEQKIRKVRERKHDLEQKYAAWQEEQDKEGKGDELEKKTAASQPVIDAMMKLNAELDKD